MTNRTVRLSIGLVAATAIARPALSDCWEEASTRYGVPPHLLMSIARTESSLHANAVNVNAGGSRDLGLMQINTSHLSQLSKYGITEAALFNPCVSINVGAWVLSSEFARRGHTWEAVGAYNASCKKLTPDECIAVRQKYAWRVYRNMTRKTQVAGRKQPTLVPFQLAVRVSQ